MAASSVTACCRSLTPAASASERLSCSLRCCFTSSSSMISSGADRRFPVLNNTRCTVLELQSFFSSNLRPLQRGVTRRASLKQHSSSTICAATPDLAAGAGKSVPPLTIRDAQIVAQPPEDGKLKIRVDIDGEATKRAFDTVLKDLAKHAPPIPGFRKAKGGKTSNVPLSVIYQFMGPKLVRKFVIDEIIKATLQDYVQKDGIKVKNELKTDQASDELTAIFEPGKSFGFDATLDLADEQTQDSGAATAASLDEKDSVKEPLEASV